MSKFVISKDFSGAELKLTLVKKEEYKDKEYDLYSVCKVIEKEDGEVELVPLYNETFTPKQLDAFYNGPSSFIAVKQD